MGEKPVAADLETSSPDDLPAEVPDAPWIIRSGSPTEDTVASSNAGQLLSLAVERPEDFTDAVRRVVAVLPRGAGKPLGVVFVQPLIRAETAGVTFFDGFYFEETRAAGGNQALTAGLVNRVVPADRLLPESEQMLRAILENGPAAIRACIEAVDTGLDADLDGALQLEATYFGLLSGTDEMREGTKAFLEKRKPRFSS